MSSLVATAGSVTPFLLSSPAAAAAASAQQQKDKDNIVKGYNRLQYLLDNWEAETTVCKTGQEVRMTHDVLVFSFYFTVSKLMRSKLF